MAKIYIFSGTTEGREISEILCKNGIENKVFVATEYGEVVMNENRLCTIEKGRLDYAQMEALFMKEEPDMVVDATHPYAIEVSKNIKSALEACNLKERYLRVQREIPFTEELLREDYKDVNIVLSTDEAIEALKKTKGNILLTTGVKTLKKYAGESSLKDRLVARILPSRESLEMAYEAGLLPHQIIAMEGPFLAELNEATIKQYNIKTLVTKNSGAKGGFLEKLEACKNTGVLPIVIDMAKQAEGVSLSEAQKLLLKKFKPKKSDVTSKAKRQISIVGIGAGNEATITVAARAAIKSATLLIGAARMIEIGLSINPKAKAEIQFMPQAVLEACDKSDDKKIAFLVSGDTGFFSGATAVKEALVDKDYIVRVFPGISSIAYFASLIGLAYSDAAVVSAHGRECDLKAVFETNNKVFAIVSGFEDVNEITDRVVNTGRLARIYVGYNLGSEDEEVVDFMSNEATAFTKQGLYVVGVVFHE